MKKDYRAQTVTGVEKIANSTGVHVRGTVHAAERIQRNLTIHPASVGLKNAIGRLFGR